MKTEVCALEEGTVFDISRYCLDDGPGIRTTVFLKGCPLRCQWCHNPESLSREVEIGYEAGKCVGCGACVSACPHHCHQLREGRHLFNRESCTACGQCVAVCEHDALSRMGEKMTVAQVMKTVERDRPFYESSGGGLTLSGGEALYQPVFTAALLRAAREKGISTCVETCGFAGEQTLMAIAPDVDLFLFDCKQMDPALHKQATGVDNAPILRNLRQLDKAGKATVLRLPLIPGVNDNDSHFAAVGALADSLDNLLYLEVMPYHPLGLSKASLLGRQMPYGNAEIPPPETVNDWVGKIQRHTAKKVIHSKS